MAQIKLAVCILGIITCFGLDVSDATLCKPFSEFKVDCNTCRCGSDGMKYSCTDIMCSPLLYKNKYVIEPHPKGYLILKPKDGSDTQGGKKLNNQNELSVNDNEKVRRQRFVSSTDSPFVTELRKVLNKRIPYGFAYSGRNDEISRRYKNPYPYYVAEISSEEIDNEIDNSDSYYDDDDINTENDRFAPKDDSSADSEDYSNEWIPLEDNE